ncbi:MAG TPA: TrbI F-type domain-containing protein [Gammaproteobacteria bacterium]|nr:TrbI F-type domain-containing protein [Gammaproteobacteria bacterium]
MLTILQRNKAKTLDFITQLLIGMLGAAILFIFFHLEVPAKPIVTVDVSGMINRFIKSETAVKLPPEKMQKQVQAFGNTLENTLHTFARQKQVILLPKEAVIAGTKDVSLEIESRLKAKLPPANRNF